eukprot:1867960-Prymnesium_polylepis.1
MMSPSDSGEMSKGTKPVMTAAAQKYEMIQQRVIDTSPMEPCGSSAGHVRATCNRGACALLGFGFGLRGEGFGLRGSG